MVALLQVRVARPHVHRLGQMASCRRLHPEVPIPKHKSLSLPRLPNFSKKNFDSMAEHVQTSLLESECRAEEGAPGMKEMLTMSPCDLFELIEGRTLWFVGDSLTQVQQ